MELGDKSHPQIIHSTANESSSPAHIEHDPQSQHPGDVDDDDAGHDKEELDVTGEWLREALFFFSFSAVSYLLCVIFLFLIFPITWLPTCCLERVPCIHNQSFLCKCIRIHLELLQSTHPRHGFISGSSFDDHLNR